MKKTNLSVNLFLVNGLIPDDAQLVTNCAVQDENHPIGAALIKFPATGIYAMYNAGIISSCDQDAAAEIDREFTK